ncbi:MAG: hypothetical protein LQ343_006389 [Gyalolechia ehrenbergii]|nr:MAG: hypothetical protein LQ343_006389 [Gyalolechia ehrenbergii]
MLAGEVHDLTILPSSSCLQKASDNLAPTLPREGYGIQKTTSHILEDIAPALNRQALSPNYYGFVTGGITPTARVAEEIVSLYDQNVQVHLPATTIATTLEDRALKLLLELLEFEVKAWPDRTFTTGATASNIMGLACGREHVINQAIRKRKRQTTSNNVETVGDVGLLAACKAADITDIQILTTMPHSSLKKASSVVGLGRSCFHQVNRSDEELEFDLELLEERLTRPHTASIVVISCAEVNTGRFATHSELEVKSLRSLCDKYGAWVHIDAAFGIFARVLEDSDEFNYVRGGVEGLDLADSIAGDAHKLLNVPYDCGFFFSRHAGMTQEVFQNPNAAYLSSGNSSPDSVQSPLNIGLENSRRFRALPVYASLVSYSRNGYRDMLQRQIRLARRIAGYLTRHPYFDLLPQNRDDMANIDERTYIIVLFRAKDDFLNATLVQRLNASSQIYVSGTAWDGRPACRIAVANWQVDVERDLAIVQSVVEEILEDKRRVES